MYGISPQVTAIPEGIPEGATVDESLIYKGAKQARNTSGTIGYYGPCPPDPPHSYIFTLYALDKVVEFTSGQSLSLITNAIEGHVLDSAQLVGNY